MNGNADAGSRLPLPVASVAVLVMFLWALCFPLINVGLADAPPMAIAALRAAIAGFVLIVVAQCLRCPPVNGLAIWGKLVVVALTATSLGFLGMFYGGGSISPGLATVVASTQPLIAAVLACRLLQEQLAPIQRWGLFVGFIGILLVAVPTIAGANSEFRGLILILIAALGVAISNVMLKRLAGQVDVLRAMGWQLLIGGVPLGLIAVTEGDFSQIHWSAAFLLNLTILSAVGTSAAFALWFSLLQHASVSELNVFSFLTPIFGLVLGAVFFAERIVFVQFFGIGFSLLGIYMVSRPKRISAALTSIDA